MKKTIIALLALAGAAFGAEYTTETVWTANFGSAYTGGYTTTLTTSTSGTFWDAADIAVEGGAQTRANKRIHMEGGTYGDWNTNFEFAITLTLTGDSITAGHIAEIKSGPTSDWLCLGVNANGALTLTGNEISAATGTGSLALGTQYTLTFAKIGTELTLSAGNASVTATLGSADAYTGIINNIALGGNTGSDRRVPVLVESISWSNATPAPVVPEPATATLSLLALAGLAARRRRK